jgi:hypothetical protein
MTDSPTYREVPVEDALEQQAPVGSASVDESVPGDSAADLPDDVPEADALEQATTASAAAPRLSAAMAGSDVLAEVNEADAADQRVEVDLDDDYDR